MIQVDFRSVGTAKCGWCQKEKEVFSVAFADESFVGNLCWVDLRRALRMKAGSAAPKSPAMTNGPAVVAQK